MVAKLNILSELMNKASPAKEASDIVFLPVRLCSEGDLNIATASSCSASCSYINKPTIFPSRRLWCPFCLPCCPERHQSVSLQFGLVVP